MRRRLAILLLAPVVIAGIVLAKATDEQRPAGAAPTVRFGHVDQPEHVVAGPHPHALQHIDVEEDSALVHVAEDVVVPGEVKAREPVAAVQFHPESILTLDGNVGLELLRNVVRYLVAG